MILDSHPIKALTNTLSVSFSLEIHCAVVVFSQIEYPGRSLTIVNYRIRAVTTIHDRFSTFSYSSYYDRL